ncbi:MAG: TetR/AcrR family transcriptional regulator [Lachnospiraceae bacterium]|nr:TetR/AcrR family transcriptional regulator [Lachnospiraceae bacterium]
MSKGKSPAKTTATRNIFLEKSYELFSTKTIESVTMAEIAKASGYRNMTLYRYFPTKPILVVAVSAWKWDQFAKEIWEGWESEGYDDKKSAAVHFELYLDFFLKLFRDHRDFLSFNQCFNVYVRSEQIDLDSLGPYQEMIGRMKDHFHNTVYLKAQQDHTIRTDEPEEEMFSKTLHIMLATVTRYAVGLLYTESGFDAEKELEYLKALILKDYRI